MPFCHSTETGEAGFGYIEDNYKIMLDNRPNFRPIAFLPGVPRAPRGLFVETSLTSGKNIDSQNPLKLHLKQWWEQ